VVGLNYFAAAGQACPAAKMKSPTAETAYEHFKKEAIEHHRQAKERGLLYRLLVTGW
jgi:hypothetical protein